MSLNSKMGRKHEDHLAQVFDTTRMPGSGNQWRGQMDGRNNRRTSRFAFAWDGKSTLAKSLSIPRKMWEKAREQAGGERPMLALRFYDNERLDVGEDLVVIGLDDFAEMLEVANAEPEEPRPVLVFVTGKDIHAETAKGVSPLAISLYPRVIVVRDGRVERATGITVSYGIERPTEVKIDGKPETGPVHIYIDNVLRYEIYPRLREMKVHRMTETSE